MAGDWAPQMRSFVQAHAGIVPISRLVELGCSKRDAYRLVDSGEFEVIMPGILLSSHWPKGLEQLMMAACWRNPSVLVAATTAARLWKFRGMGPDDGEVYMLAPHGSMPKLPGVTVRQTRQLDPTDIVRRADGLRLTSPPRTLFDCADQLGLKRSSSIFEQLLNDGKGTFVTYAATVARLGRPGRPGSRVMSAAVASRPAWRAALQSELEVLVLREIERQGLPAPEVQFRITLPAGERIRLDFAWPRLAALLEVDHPFWHAGAGASYRDKRRDLEMTSMGWVAMRITDLDVHAGLPASIRKVGLTLARR